MSLEKGAGKPVETETAEKSPLRTKRRIEDAVREEICHFEQDYTGQEPKEIHAYLLGDLLVVRLRSALVDAEQQLAKLLPAEKGRGLLKKVRSSLIETTHPIMEAIVEKVTGVKVVTMHHDASTETDEEVLVFTLAKAPDFLK